MSGVRLRDLDSADYVLAGDYVAVDGDGKVSVEKATGSQIGLLAGNTVWVDAVNGSDDTGAAGYRSRPFLGPEAALDAASSGDCVIVLPGEYTLEAAMAGKDDVNWLWLPGVTITGASGLSVFSVTSAFTFKVIAFGASMTSDALLGTVRTAHASANVDVYGGTITNTGTSYAALNSAGTIRIRNATISNNASAACVGHAGTSSRYDSCDITNSTGAGAFINANGAVFQGGRVSGATKSFDANSAYSVSIYGSVSVFGSIDSDITIIGGTARSDGLEADTITVTGASSFSGAVTVADSFVIEDGSGTAFNAEPGAAPTIGFFGTGPIVKPTVTGSKGANAALASLCTALANLGLITDSTS